MLANERRLDGAALAGASDDVMEALYTWYQDGWIELALKGEQHMDEAGVHTVSSHAREFERALARVHRRARWPRCDMFDPGLLPCSRWARATSTPRCAVFLARGGHLQLAMHRSGHIERNYPRFLRLLNDYSHRIECRVTGRNLHQLTDSFCIGDGVHIVRRFHSDHMRGEAAFNMPQATEISAERFGGIWAESLPGLHADHDWLVRTIAQMPNIIRFIADQLTISSACSTFATK